jgi:hypothetical protein
MRFFERAAYISQVAVIKQVPDLLLSWNKSGQHKVALAQIDISYRIQDHELKNVLANLTANPSSTSM